MKYVNNLDYVIIYSPNPSSSTTCLAFRPAHIPQSSTVVSSSSSALGVESTGVTVNSSISGSTVPTCSSPHSIMNSINSRRKPLGLDTSDNLSLFSSINGFHGNRNPKPQIQPGMVDFYMHLLTGKLIEKDWVYQNVDESL